jgi:hypothetical protein
MKSLRDYIAETEDWIDDPAQGDEFDIELAPDSLLETHVVDITEDGIILEADEPAMALLEQHGLLGERIGTYGAVGYGGMGQTFFEKEQEIAEHGGGIGPKAHWQSMMEEDDLAIPGTQGMDDAQRHAAIMKHYPEAKRVGSTPGVYATKSGRLISGIQGVRHLKNEEIEEGAIKELDIQIQDYKSMTPQQFQSAYGMKKADWAMKHGDLLQKHGLQTDWTGKSGFDFVREASRILELAGVADHRYDKADDVYHEDQSAAIVAKKELDMDAALDLGMKEEAEDMDESALQAYLGRKKYGEEGMKALQQAGREGASKEKMARIRAQHDKMAEAEMDEAKYQGREVPLGKPMKGDVKKSKVYVRGPKGNVVKVNFGDKSMRIKKSNPKRRKSFRARHNCANPGPRHKARYWSCRAW